MSIKDQALHSPYVLFNILTNESTLIDPLLFASASSVGYQIASSPDNSYTNSASPALLFKVSYSSNRMSIISYNSARRSTSLNLGR
jgi:hypothetical protein